MNNLTFLIDLDNTLIYTDRANNLAYEKAMKETLKSALGNELFSNLQTKTSRITRETLSQLNSLDTYSLEKIIRLKEDFYHHFLFATKSNEKVINDIIKTICFNNRTQPESTQKILVTNCSASRANALLDYHQLNNYFQQSIFCPNIPNKFEFALNRLAKNISHKHIFILDDDIRQINDIMQKSNIPNTNFINITGA